MNTRYDSPNPNMHTHTRTCTYTHSHTRIYSLVYISFFRVGFADKANQDVVNTLVTGQVSPSDVLSVAI